MANGSPTTLDEQLELPSVARALSHLWAFRFIYRSLARAARVSYLPGALVLLILAAGRVLAELGRVLDAMHPLGGEGFKVNDLSPVFSAGTPPAKIVAGWSDWYSQTAPSIEGGPTSPSTIAGWWLALDFFVFVPAYALLLGILTFRANARLKATSPPIWNATIYRRLLALAFIAIPFMVGVEFVENLLQGLLVAGVTTDWVAIPARAASGAKWLLVFLTIVPLLAAWIAIGWRSAVGMSGAPEWARDLLLYRMLVLAVAIFAFLLMGPRMLSEQSLDVLRRLPDDLLSAWITPLLVLLLAGVLVVCAHWLMYTARKQQARTPSGGGRMRTAVAVGVGALLVVAVLGVLTLAGVEVPLGFWFPPGVAALVAFLSLPVWDATREPPARPAGKTFIAHGLAAAPLLIFGLAATTAATGDVFYSRDARAGLLLALGLVFVALAGAFYIWLERWQVRSDVSPFRMPLALVVLGVGLVVAVLLEVGAIGDPWTSARLTGGAIGITAGFIVLLVLVGSGLSWIAERFTVPAFFVVFRFRRIPVITLLIAWFAVASLIDRDGFHAVRTRPTSSPLARPGAQVDLETAWKRWLETAPTVAEPGRSVRPLLLATSAGGGIRAAYWTALVLDCLVHNPNSCKQPGPRLDAGSLFVASGISGGSLGLVEYAARQQRPVLAGRDWVDERLDDDYLGPTIARMLFVDSPNALLRARWWDDRSAILEGAWERSWGEGSRGPLDEGLYQRGLRFPLLLLNGASVTDGCRFEASILRGVTPRDPSDELVTDCRAMTQFDGQRVGGSSPAYVPPAARKNWVFAATRELDRSLCAGLDVRLSTAALLSARFPYVTPSGSLGCEGPGKETSYIVDGGYFDTSGVSPVVELWQSLEPLVAEENAKGGACVVPLLLEIDNHYAEPAGASNGSRPNELFVPLQALTNARDAREANARIAGAIAFSTNPTGGVDVTEAGATADRVAHIYPRAHPGTEAPLGWTLSRVAAEDLRRELTTPVVGEDVEKVRRWFTPGALRCEPAP